MTPSPTLVLLTFALEPPSSLNWLVMNELILEGRRKSWNCRKYRFTFRNVTRWARVQSQSHVSRSSRSNWKVAIMVSQERWAYGIGRPLSSVCMYVVNIFKHLLWNHWADWSQLSYELHYEASMGWENESLFKWSWSPDQDGRHVHILWKP